MVGVGADTDIGVDDQLCSGCMTPTMVHVFRRMVAPKDSKIMVILKASSRVGEKITG